MVSKSLFNILVIVIMIPGCLFGQLGDDFSDGDLTNGTLWQGNVDHFIVNEDFQLQMDAPEPGMSSLYTTVVFPDSVRWKGYALYDFAPSTNNKGGINIAIDNPDLNIASGYILRFGENGSDDAINFIRLDAGVETLLTSGTLGAVGADPAEFEYTITLDGSGMWSAEIGYNGGFPMLEFTITDTTYPLPSLSIFGIQSTYTTSNVDNVFFDDLIIEEDLPDTTPPMVTAINVLDVSEIQIGFNESMDIASLEIADNYLLSPTNQAPSQVITDALNPSQVTLIYDPNLMGNIEYTLLVSGCTDTAGNIMADAMEDFFIPDTPIDGDLKLSEILFDPYIDQSDFVEIYNSSDKILSLDGVFIANLDKDERDYILDGIIMQPKSYLAISDDIAGVIDIYSPPDTANLLEQPIPSFNNSDGDFSVGITTQDGDQIFESFGYEEDFQAVLLDDTEGVSLGRLSFVVASDDSDNWLSGAESTNFATPGYRNGASINFDGNLDDFVGLESDVFSPNGDGDKELLTILFEMDKPGFAATVKIFDYRGQEVRSLITNQLIAEQDFANWDGLMEDGRPANVGPYIIYISAFHPDGDVRDKKLPAVLADFLD